MSRRLVPYGERAVLIEVEPSETVLGLYAALADSKPPGVVDIVPAARTVTVTFRPDRAALATVRAWVQEAEVRPAADEAREPIEIEVEYSGEDLPEVASRLGMTPEEVVDLHVSSAWHVAFTGFSPGFGYLVTDHDRLVVPRRESPRTVVPAGSVALAGGFCGVYPRPSPGGWQLIGRTERPMWDSDSDTPALLTPGRTVRFRSRG